MSPRRNVPVVSTTAPQPNSRPSPSRSPATRPSRMMRSSASASITVRLSVARIAACIAAAYSLRSAWARGPRTAGPLRRLSTRNWMPPQSATRPMSPSRASISRTRCPLPRPPIAGLHDMAPTVETLWVTSAVAAPMRAAAAAASQPACPPPTTITSNRVFISQNSPEAAACIRAVAQRQKARGGSTFHVKQRGGPLLVNEHGKRTANVCYRPIVRSSFADAEFPEDHVEYVFHVDASGQALERARGHADLLGDQFLTALAALRPVEGERAIKRRRGHAQHLAVAFARDQHGLTREKAPGECAQSLRQLIDPLACRRRNRKAPRRLEQGVDCASAARHQVDLVGQKPDLAVREPPVLGDGRDRACCRLARIKDPQHQVGHGDGLPRAPHALLLDRVVRWPNARCVTQRHWIARKVEMDLDHVAGRAGVGRHDRGLAFGEAVEQRRLADVGRASDRNL